MATSETKEQPSVSDIVEAYTPIYLREGAPGIDRRDSSERISKPDPPSAAAAV